jgi:hypothetical protein
LFLFGSLLLTPYRNKSGYGTKAIRKYLIILAWLRSYFARLVSQRRSCGLEKLYNTDFLAVLTLTPDLHVLIWLERLNVTPLKPFI